MTPGKKIKFENISEGLKKELKDLSEFKTYSLEKQKKFIGNRKKLLHKVLTNLDAYSKDTKEICDDYYYTQICLIYEYTVTLCLLSDYWNEYFQIKGDRDFNLIKNILLKKIKKDKDYKKLGTILEYIHVQRNNFLHFPFKIHDYCGIHKELCWGLFKLNSKFKLRLNKDLLKKSLNYPDIKITITEVKNG